MKCTRKRTWPHSARLRGRAARGFTLLEVLIALAIIAIALISALRASGSMVTANDELHRRLLADWSADNYLVELRLAHDWPDLGTRSFDCPQGDVYLVCDEEVAVTANPTFRRVVIRVHDASRADATLAETVGLIPNETVRPL
jgi:general secretion pathway protein I